MAITGNLFSHKGFMGSIEYSLDEQILHGRIECIQDLVTYQAETIADLQQAFIDAVDDYLATCEQLGKQPDKPMSGTFNVRIGAKLHKKAYLAAKSLSTTLNDFVKQAIEEKINAEKAEHSHIHKAV